MRLARLKRIVRRGASAEAEGGAKDQETIVSLLKRPDAKRHEGSVAKVVVLERHWSE